MAKRVVYADCLEQKPSEDTLVTAEKQRNEDLFHMNELC